MSEIYRLVYTSRNLLQGSEGERAKAVAEILATSQANNARIGVTGALLFNGGYFAQVLEGPRPLVENTFERIQRDPRHSDVSVLQCEPVAVRGFPNWSMAFIGQSARSRELWQDIESRTGFDLALIEGHQLFATLQAIVLAEEGSTGEQGLTADLASTSPLSQARPEAAIRPARRHDQSGMFAKAQQNPDVRGSGLRAVDLRSKGEVLDIERLRAELRETSPEARPVASVNHHASESMNAAHAPETTRSASNVVPAVEASMLRAALAEERERTTDLRRNLDEARIALSLAGEQIETLRRQRDVWASRARLLASALCQDPDDEDVVEQSGIRGVA